MSQGPQDFSKCYTCSLRAHVLLVGGTALSGNHFLLYGFLNLTLESLLPFPITWLLSLAAFLAISMSGRPSILNPWLPSLRCLALYSTWIRENRSGQCGCGGTHLFFLFTVDTGCRGHFDHTLTSLACLAAWVAFLMSGRSATVV